LVWQPSYLVFETSDFASPPHGGFAFVSACAFVSLASGRSQTHLTAAKGDGQKADTLSSSLGDIR